MRQPTDDETLHGPSKVVPVAADLRVGTRVGAYEIEEVAGRGGMGVVYRAKHVHLGRTVALKVLVPELIEDAGFRERFLRESRLAASINHPSIITTYDAGEADDLLYIAMQYVDGAHLGELLQDASGLEPRRALSFLNQIAAALDAAHAHGIVHRDVKPANVLIDSERCYLTDFGLTKRISSQTALTAKGQFVGTVHYMAPEQIKAEAVDARTDVYALGCLAYQALVGRVPFERDSEVAIVYSHLQEPPPSLTGTRPDLPTGLDGVLAAALAKKKEDRQASCGQLVAALEAELEGAHGVSDTSDPTIANLLVAAHEPRTRALVRASVKGAPLRVLEAGDRGSMTSVARRGKPRLALIDWDMHERSDADADADVCGALRDDPETRDIKILMMATRAQAADWDAIRCGADDCILKPFSPLQLLYKIRDLAGAGLVEA